MHRIYHILNRNISNEAKFDFDEIRKPFFLSNHNSRDTFIIHRFFKELDTDDIDSFCEEFSVSKELIKKTYLGSAVNLLSGVRKKWEPYFKDE